MKLTDLFEGSEDLTKLSMDDLLDAYNNTGYTDDRENWIDLEYKGIDQRGNFVYLVVLNDEEAVENEDGSIFPYYVSEFFVTQRHSDEPTEVVADCAGTPLRDELTKDMALRFMKSYTNAGWKK
jgi:hypothetical protein